MAGNLGSLTVSIGLDAAEFVDGLSKSEYAAKRFSVQLDRAIAGGIIKAQIAIEALGAAARVATEAFAVLTKGAGDFQDLAETTGAAAQDLASLAVAAATAGVEMADVAGSVNRLTKSLVGVDDESKAAGAALASIGISVEDFKKLDPVGQYEAVGKALAGYADGAGKVAVAQALFGKTGAEQLKVFKALEEQGGAQTILTQRQIELSDAYADQQAKTTAQLRLFAQAAASEAIPAISDLLRVAADFAKELHGVDAASGQLATNNGVKAFAEGVADALAFAADQADLFVRLFQLAGKAVAGYAAVSVSLAKGNFAEAKLIGAEVAADLEATMNRITFADRLAKQRIASINSSLGQAPTELARRGKAPAMLPQISFAGGVRPSRSGGAGTSDRQSEADRYLESLQRQIEKTQELSAVDQVLNDLQSNRVKGIGADQGLRAIELAEQIDASKHLAAQLKAEQQQMKDFEDSRKRLADEGRKVFEATRTPAEQLSEQIDELNRLLEAGVVSWDTYARATFAAQDAFDKAEASAKKTGDQIDSFAKHAAENIQDQLGSTLADILGGNFKNIGDGFKKLIDRMVAEALAADIAKKLFGDSVKGGSGSGLFGDLLGQFGEVLGLGGKTQPKSQAPGGGFFDGIFKSIGGFFGGGMAVGGPTLPNTFYEVGERRPEVFDDGSRQFLLTGSRRGRVDPNPALGSTHRTINAPITIVMPPGTSRATADQAAAAMAQRLALANARLN